MIAAFFKAWDDVWRPRMRSVLWKCVGLSLLTAIAVMMGVYWLVAGTELVGSLPWVGGVVETLVDVLGWFAAFALMILLLPAFLGMYAGFYIETICRAVEERHYPHLPAPREQSIPEAVGTGAKFLVILVFVNLVMLPFALFFPPIGWIVNGYLLGREYMEMVGFRRHEPKEVEALRARYRGRIFLAGFILALIATVPVLNLLLPLVGLAFMLHVHEILQRIEVR